MTTYSRDLKAVTLACIDWFATLRARLEGGEVRSLVLYAEGYEDNQAMCRIIVDVGEAPADVLQRLTKHFDAAVISGNRWGGQKGPLQ